MLRVSNTKFNLIFFKVELGLVTQFRNLRIPNSFFGTLYVNFCMVVCGEGVRVNDDVYGLELLIVFSTLLPLLLLHPVHLKHKGVDWKFSGQHLMSP